MVIRWASGQSTETNKSEGGRITPCVFFRTADPSLSMVRLSGVARYTENFYLQLEKGRWTSWDKSESSRKHWRGCIFNSMPSKSESGMSSRFKVEVRSGGSTVKRFFSDALVLGQILLFFHLGRMKFRTESPFLTDTCWILGTQKHAVTNVVLLYWSFFAVFVQVPQRRTLYIPTMLFRLERTSTTFERATAVVTSWLRFSLCWLSHTFVKQRNSN